MAGRGKPETGVPLVLRVVSPDKSLVPGRACKLLVTSPAREWRSRLEESFSVRDDLGRLPALAFAVQEEPPCPTHVAAPCSPRRRLS